MSIRIRFCLLTLMWAPVITLSSGCREGDQTTLQFFHMTWLPEMVQLVDTAVAHFEREHPHIRIEQTRVGWSDASTQLLTSIMGGAAPDISHANPNIAAQFRNLGAYADLTEAIPVELQATFLPTTRYVIETPAGRIDGYPTEGSTWAFFYRKDLFSDAGIAAPPRTWGELVVAALALTAAPMPLTNSRDAPLTSMVVGGRSCRPPPHAI